MPTDIAALHSALIRFPILVFDLDGTLIDSAPEIGAGLNQLLRENGRAEVTLDQVRSFVGDGAARLIAQAFAATGEPLLPEAVPAILKRYLTIYATVPADPSCLYPGVDATLRQLRQAGFRLGICTNKPESITLALLPMLGLADLFDTVIGGDTLPQRKPAPEPLQAAIQRLGGAIDGAAMIGDNANDVAAARATGIPVIAVSYGYPRMNPTRLGADLLIDKFAELPAALIQLAT